MNQAADLLSIEIKGLFGQFDYMIEMPENNIPLVLTGPNGYGKTTILSIIKAISDSNLIYLYSLTFSEIIATYSDGICLTVKSGTFDNTTEQDNNSSEAKSGDFDIRIGEESKARNSNIGKRLLFALSSHGATTEFELDDSKIKRAIRAIGYYRRIEQTNADINSPEYYEFLQEHSDTIYEQFSRNDSAAASFFFYLEAIAKTTLIPAQRLFSIEKSIDSRPRSEWRLKERIEEISHDLQLRLRRQQSRFLMASQMKDSDFIERAISDNILLSEEDYAGLKTELCEKIDTLQGYGLVGELRIPDYKENYSGILSCFLIDLKEKLSAFDSILNKIFLFSKLAKEKHFTNKTIEITADKGLRMRTGDNRDGFVDLRKLSSGEKNQLIMLYDFIFNVEDGSTLLIDEPELSLHVAWQLTFLKEITDIALTKRLNVIVATHSPQIINSRWDDCFDLYAATN